MRESQQPTVCQVVATRARIGAVQLAADQLVALAGGVGERIGFVDDAVDLRVRLGPFAGFLRGMLVDRLGDLVLQSVFQLGGQREVALANCRRRGDDEALAQPAQCAEFLLVRQSGQVACADWTVEDAQCPLDRIVAGGVDAFEQRSAQQ